MKEKQILDALEQVNEDFIEEANFENGKIKRRAWVKWTAMAACFVAAALVAIPVLSLHNTIPLSDASVNVRVRYIDNADTAASSMDLVYFTEEELFTACDTAIFKGTITKIDNIVVDYNGSENYMAIANIDVEKVFRGDCAEGETVSVLLPCPIDKGIWVEDTEMISAMRVGMTGIFMPIQYDDTSTREENGAVLLLRDLAPYGFSDDRFVFLETDNGLLFSKWAYESISNVTSMDEIETYIEEMIK